MTSPPGSCPLDRYQGVLWSLPVEVGGRERRFLLDVGAGLTSLDARLCDELGLRVTERFSAQRMTGELLELQLVEAIPLRVAGTVLTPRSLGRIDFATLLPPGWPRVDGVLALDVLERQLVRVGFAADRLHLGSVGDVAEMTQLGVRLRRATPDVSLDVLVAVAAPDGDDLWLELDNSNTGPVLLSPAAAARLGLPPSAERATLEVRGLASFTTPILVRDLVLDGNLGRTFVDGRTFAFDLAAGAVWVT